MNPSLRSRETRSQLQGSKAPFVYRFCTTIPLTSAGEKRVSFPERAVTQGLESESRRNYGSSSGSSNSSRGDASHPLPKKRARVVGFRDVVGSLQLAGPESTLSDELPPKVWLCPLSGQLMTHAAVAADGWTYQEDSIRKWLSENNDSPVTGEIIEHREIILPNHSMRHEIQLWLQRHRNTTSPS